MKCSRSKPKARIIRREERRLLGGSLLRDELSWHRRLDVRVEARLTYLAYGIVRGTALERIEKPIKPRSPELWKRVRAMVEKYGPVDKEARAGLLNLCQG